MRNTPDPNDKYDQQELENLEAEPWMIELLALSPEYTCWGPHEDYMCKEGDGWDTRVLKNSWREFREPDSFSPGQKGWELDDLNECVNFYFEIERASTECVECDQTGYNPETKQISDDFYDFENTGARWCDKVTQDEVDALVEAGRLRRWDKENHCWVACPRTAEEVNAVNRRGAKPVGDLHSHDAINRSILIEARAKRLGCYGMCPVCKGNGYNYTEPRAHVNLVLWMLHPRKGCSRGIEIRNIKQEDLPEIFSYLHEAAERNANRFKGIANPSPEVKELLVSTACKIPA